MILSGQWIVASGQWIVERRIIREVDSGQWIVVSGAGAGQLREKRSVVSETANYANRLEFYY